MQLVRVLAEDMLKLGDLRAGKQLPQFSGKWGCHQAKDMLGPTVGDHGCLSQTLLTSAQRTVTHLVPSGFLWGNSSNKFTSTKKEVQACSHCSSAEVLPSRGWLWSTCSPDKFWTTCQMTLKCTYTWSLLGKKQEYPHPLLTWHLSFSTSVSGLPFLTPLLLGTSLSGKLSHPCRQGGSLPVSSPVALRCLISQEHLPIEHTSNRYLTHQPQLLTSCQLTGRAVTVTFSSIFPPEVCVGF